MSNLVTQADIERALEKGCWHNYGYHDQSICKKCREDILTHIRRLVQQLNIAGYQ